MRFPSKMYDKMCEQERTEMMNLGGPETTKKEKSDESVFDDPEEPVIKEKVIKKEPEQDPEPEPEEGGDPDES